MPPRFYHHGHRSLGDMYYGHGYGYPYDPYYSYPYYSYPYYGGNYGLYGLYSPSALFYSTQFGITPSALSYYY